MTVEEATRVEDDAADERMSAEPSPPPTRAERWERRVLYCHRQLAMHLRRHVPAGSRVLHVGCGLGDLLTALGPGDGFGIDPNPETIEVARQRHPHLRFDTLDPETFECDETFDRVVITGALANVTDIAACLDSVRGVCRPDTRLVVCYDNPLWQPAFQLARWLGLPRPVEKNWPGARDVANFLTLAGFEIVRRSTETLLPVRVKGLNGLFNRFLARVWPLSHLCLTRIVVARPACPPPDADTMTCTVVIPTRDERGNVEDAVRRMPEIGGRTEIIFVDGNSTDGTVEEINRVTAAYPDKDIRLIDQGDGVGKGDAVRKGFAAATGDVLMILDADLTVPPEDLPRFFRPIVEGTAEFVNGTRLFYPMEKLAMRYLNTWGNRFFSGLFTWLLGQRFTDTLCGTKVLSRRHYEIIAANRAYFGDFDPFGDFDLIFGAVKADLKIIEVPVRYRARTYGETKISRFRHGWLLLKMSWVAFRRLKWR